MGGRECFSETIHQMGISLTSIWCDFIGNYAVIFNTNKSKTHSHEHLAGTVIQSELQCIKCIPEALTLSMMYPLRYNKFFFFIPRFHKIYFFWKFIFLTTLQCTICQKTYFCSI